MIRRAALANHRALRAIDVGVRVGASDDVATAVLISRLRVASAVVVRRATQLRPTVTRPIELRSVTAIVAKRAREIIAGSGRIPDAWITASWIPLKRRTASTVIATRNHTIHGSSNSLGNRRTATRGAAIESAARRTAERLRIETRSTAATDGRTARSIHTRHLNRLATPPAETARRITARTGSRRARGARATAGRHTSRRRSAETITCRRATSALTPAVSLVIVVASQSRARRKKNRQDAGNCRAPIKTIATHVGTLHREQPTRPLPRFDCLSVLDGAILRDARTNLPLHPNSSVPRKFCRTRRAALLAPPCCPRIPSNS